MKSNVTASKKTTTATADKKANIVNVIVVEEYTSKRKIMTTILEWKKRTRKIKTLMKCQMSPLMKLLPRNWTTIKLPPIRLPPVTCTVDCTQLKIKRRV